MADVIAYEAPTAYSRALRRYQAWQRRMAVMRKVRWWWLGVVAAGFLLAALLALGGRQYEDARGYVLVFVLLIGTPVYILIVTMGACGKIWPIPLAVICGTVACFFALGAFVMLRNWQSGTALMFGLVSVFFTFLWSSLVFEWGRLPFPRVGTE